MRVRLTHGIHDLADHLDDLAKKAPRRLNDVVRDAAERGNRNARGFASEQHTMFSDVDVDYAPSFTVEKIGPMAYEYGPDSALPQGSKASGYELGSVNQASPHRNLDRSLDIERIEFPMDVSDEIRLMFKQANF